jgi:hypothetical protein
MNATEYKAKIKDYVKDDAIDGVFVILNNLINNLVGGDFSKIEKQTAQDSMMLARKMITKGMEKLDDCLLEDKPKNLVAKSIDKRQLITTIGEITFSRRRFIDKFTNENVYLLDEKKGIRKGAKLSKNLSMQLSCNATNESYRNASMNLEYYTNTNVAPATIKHSIADTTKVLKDRTKIEDKLWNKCGKSTGKIQAEKLCVESDGVYIPLQRNKNQIDSGKPKKAEISISKAYSGKRFKKNSKNKECVNKTIYAGIESKDSFWKNTSAHIASKFDVSKIKNIYHSTDGEVAYKNGDCYLPGKTTHSLDPWHLHNAINACFRIEDKYLANRLKKLLIYENNFPKAISFLSYLEESANNNDAKERVNTLKTYILNNREGIENNKLSLGTMEATNAHIIGSRFKRFGGAWSIEGADNLVRLKAYMACNEDDSKEYNDIEMLDIKEAAPILKEALSSTYASKMNDGVKGKYEGKVGKLSDERKAKNNFAKRILEFGTKSI